MSSEDADEEAEPLEETVVMLSSLFLALDM